MKYLGNYKDCIKQEWFDFFSQNRGTARPAEGKKPDSDKEESEYAKLIKVGYSAEATYFYMFDKNNCPFELELPFIDSKFHWWVTKMLPGDFMPMHVDPHTTFEENSHRYWIPLQDWQPGHIFMYEDTVITDYKAGDVWVYEDSQALHGAANIGYVPRIVIQVSTYN